MTYRVLITSPAEQDLFHAINWLRQHRSSKHALKWYTKMVPAINALAEQPDRCPLAPETDLLPTGVRQQHFGLDRKATDRIVFAIVGQEVRVLRIDHVPSRASRWKIFLI